jgi:hypothetical protein
VPEPIDAPDAHNTKALAKLISDMEARFEQEYNDLKIKHAQDIQRLGVESAQREREFLKDCKEEYQEQTKALVRALLKTKLERDGLLLAVSWIALGALVFGVFRVPMHGFLSKALVLAALSGAIGAIIVVGGSLKRNRGRLTRVKEGIIDTAPQWGKDDSLPFTFLIFGFTATVFLGLSLFIHVPQKVAVVKPVALPQTKAAVDNKVVGTPAASVPVDNAGKPSVDARQSTSTVKISGNGGNFVGGSVDK